MQPDATGPADVETLAEVETAVEMATPRSTGLPVKAVEETLAEVVTLDEDVQPVSGEREETQVPSGRVVRRAPSDRAARVTFGDDDAIAQVAASEADMPPRRSVGSTRSPRDAATRPATKTRTVTPTGPAGAVGTGTPQGARFESPTPQPAPAKRGWLFWRSGTTATPPEVSAAAAPTSRPRNASSQANVSRGDSEYAAPASSRASERRSAQLGLAPGEQLVEERVISDRVVGESSAPPSGLGSTKRAPDSLGTGSATRSQLAARSGSVGNAKTKASSKSGGSPRTNAVPPAEYTTTLESPAPTTAVPPAAAKPSISDRMKSFFGGRSE